MKSNDFLNFACGFCQIICQHGRKHNIKQSYLIIGEDMDDFASLVLPRNNCIVSF